MIFNGFKYNRLNMNNNLLIDFFKDMIKKLENNEINEKKLRQLSEFMLRYKFENNRPVKYQHDEFVKFLTLGWYVYSNIPDEK
tara:strand:+ start:29 stop:277 length:249 start_codon:yes stop_codon:yes gene_type:complete